MEYKQVKSINIEGVAFLAPDMPTHALTKMYIPQGIAVEFNKKCAKGDNWKYYSVLIKYHKGF